MLHIECSLFWMPNCVILPRPIETTTKNHCMPCLRPYIFYFFFFNAKCSSSLPKYAHLLFYLLYENWWCNLYAVLLSIYFSFVIVFQKENQQTFETQENFTFKFCCVNCFWNVCVSECLSIDLVNSNSPHATTVVLNLLVSQSRVVFVPFHSLLHKACYYVSHCLASIERSIDLPMDPNN